MRKVYHVKARGHEFSVTAYYSAGYRGARERGSGLQLEPDEPATLEIEKITFSHNQEYDFQDLLDDCTVQDIEQAIWEQYFGEPDED